MLANILKRHVQNIADGQYYLRELYEKHSLEQELPDNHSARAIKRSPEFYKEYFLSGKDKEKSSSILNFTLALQLGWP